MGFFSRIKKIFGTSQDESQNKEQSAREEPAREESVREQPAEQPVGSSQGEPAPVSDGAPMDEVAEAGDEVADIADAADAAEEAAGTAEPAEVVETVESVDAEEAAESVESVESVEVVEETAPAACDTPHAGQEDEAGPEAAAPAEPVAESEAAPEEEERPEPVAVQETAGKSAACEEPVIIDLLEMVSEDEEDGTGPGTSPVADSAAAQGDAGRLTGPVYQELTRRLREADARLSVWLDIVLDGVTEAGEELNDRVLFLLRTLEAPENEARAFVDDFAGWLERMDYRQLDEFRSELQYRLSLALELEDEEDERSRLLVKLADSLAKTREQFVRRFEGLISSHGELDDAFWEELEEIFIMADLGVEASMELVERLKERARAEKATTSEQARELLRQEIRSIFTRPRHIVGIEPPEVVLMIGVNGAGKTTTIAKLAYRDRMQGKKVMIAAADTFRAAAIEQLEVWAGRVGCLFHAKQAGSDPASVAYEAMDRAMKEGVDVLYVDTAGRLQTKVNLMDELAKIRNVIAKKHPGAPHRTVLVLDATTGQNALSQARLFKESAGVDELVLTKLDGTAKGGVAIAVAMQHKLPITFVGIGEKMEDLRPFSGDDYADALLKL